MGLSQNLATFSQKMTEKSVKFKSDGLYIKL